MALFIGSNNVGDNWGEEYFINKLIEYFDDSYVIYRNRPIFGAQFDVCLLAPNIGIIIFEVKAWKPDTIIRIENSDTIVIKSIDEYTGKESEGRENPDKQVRGYVYKMRSKIRQKTGKMPLVYGMVCFPNLSNFDFNNIGINPVCEYEETILKEDLESKQAFFSKMNLCIRNHKNAAKYNSKFNSDLMLRVRQIFETDLNIENQSVENTDIIEQTNITAKNAYSILSYIPHNEHTAERVHQLSQYYSVGTKLFLFVEEQEDLYLIRYEMYSVIREKGLAVNGLDLTIDFSEVNSNELKKLKDHFVVFNCSAYLLPKEGGPNDFIVVKDGNIISKKIEMVLRFADENSNFNVQQYYIEHCDVRKNVVVRAGAGTGKTYTMISRIAFICHKQLCAMKEMANRIVMITFTDDAANQMESKIKRHFNNYYLLTGDTECLAFINLIESMQISTIHAYAKHIISQLGIELGYGADLTITSGNYKLKQIISGNVDSYIVEMQRMKGMDYVTELGIPVYQIKKIILDLIMRLHNQSVNIKDLDDISFGKSVVQNGDELHELIKCVVPKIDNEANAYFRNDNRIHLSNMMSLLKACIDDNKSVKRLIKMQTGRPQFMFVDEFQDTDDIQIEALSTIAKLLQYKLFVVGDVKQCIYRFRGAKENAFDQLNYKDNKEWLEYSLYKNYRTDKYLLDLFHNTFASMGKNDVGGEKLLIYGEVDDNESGKLTGTRSYNTNRLADSYYKRITITEENERMPALFREIDRQIKFLQEIERETPNILSKEEKEVAILVRENWQADIIKKEGKNRGIEIITNTGGDLYMSEPALDMLTLANALLHFDEADYLYAFVSSNFIGGGISKSQMYLKRKEENSNNGWKGMKKATTTQTMELWKRINRELSEADEEKWKDWKSVIRLLRVMPVLQVLRKIYHILKPWVNYGQDSKLKQDNYRLNVDLLFEELIKTSNTETLTINSLVDILSANIISKKNVDSREPGLTNVDEILIRCITVHKAKGLEYGSVILPYCSYKIDALKRSDLNVYVFYEENTKIGYQIKFNEDHVVVDYQNNYFDETLETNERMREEARILYVAMTRAIRSFSWISLENVKSESWQNLIWEG